MTEPTIKDYQATIAAHEATIGEQSARLQRLELLLADQARLEAADVSLRHAVFDSIALTPEADQYMRDRDAAAAWSMVLYSFRGGQIGAEAFPGLLGSFSQHLVMLRMIQEKWSKIEEMGGDIKDRLVHHFISGIRV